MFIYSVEIAVPKGQETCWLSWMKESHIPDVMATGCFRQFRLLRILDGVETGGSGYRAEYSVEKQDDYNDYLLKHAGRLRDEFKKQFSGNFTFIRNFSQVL